MHAVAREVFVVAHRGASAYAPENTLPAFEKAAELGAHFVEADLRATRDGAIVCIHDARVDRTTNGKGFVSELTSLEVRALDAGSWFSEKYKGVKVPLLEELLDFLSSSSVGGFLEIKQPGIEDEVVSKVHRWGLEEKVVIISEHWSCLKRVKELDPSITTQADVPVPSAASINAALRFLANIVSIHVLNLEESIVTYAHRRGLLVDVWGVADREGVEKALECGVDFITADDPKMVREVIARHRGA